jgi:hypothetical protein
MTQQHLAAALVALVAAPALAQTSSSIGAPPPAMTQPQTAPRYEPPPQQPPPQYAPAQQQAQPQYTAPQQQAQPQYSAPATQPQYSAPATQPQQAPAGSQQVIVNPSPPPAQTAPSGTTVYNSTAPDRRALSQSATGATEPRSPMGTIAMNALYGGLAGALVGTGVALIEGDNWARDITVGAGLGVIVGAGVGAYTAYSGGDRVAMDGLGTPLRERDRQRPMTRVAAYAMRW